MKRKNCWVLLLLVLTGIVLGGFIGTMAQDVSWLSWLNFGQSFGLDTPLVLNLGVLVSPKVMTSTPRFSPSA